MALRCYGGQGPEVCFFQLFGWQASGPPAREDFAPPNASRLREFFVAVRELSCARRRFTVGNEGVPGVSKLSLCCWRIDISVTTVSTAWTLRAETKANERTLIPDGRAAQTTSRAEIDFRSDAVRKCASRTTESSVQSLMERNANSDGHPIAKELGRWPGI